MAEKNSFAIETFSLTKIFPDWWGRAKVIAVDDLKLGIRHNEVYGLLGPNGSGKTTTLKMLLGLLHPSKGKSLILGSEISDPEVKGKIGYLPEESYLYKYLNARETLDFYGKIFGLPGQVRKSRIEALLEMVGLSGMSNRAVGTYSKGMQRRIGLAQALINDPDLLVLDEPTSGMDPIGTRQMKDLIIELAGRGKTILLCSHLLADVEDVCNRIGIMYGGKMQVEGKVDELLSHSQEYEIKTGSLSGEAVEQIRDIVERTGQSCEISNPMDKLEDYFIRTVVDAQKQDQYTSGAFSTTNIGDFLAQQKTDSSVLDKLVSAPVDKGSEDVDVEQAESAEQRADAEASRPDKTLLEGLSGSSEPGETDLTERPVDEGTEKPIAEESEEGGSAEDEDVLRKLTDKQLGPSSETERADEGNRAEDGGDDA